MQTWVDPRLTFEKHPDLDKLMVSMRKSKSKSISKSKNISKSVNTSRLESTIRILGYFVEYVFRWVLNTSN